MRQSITRDVNTTNKKARSGRAFSNANEISGLQMLPPGESGVGFVPPEEPRGNLTGDPWFTDGNRAVMLLTLEPTDVLGIEWLDWTDDGVIEETD